MRRLAAVNRVVATAMPVTSAWPAAVLVIGLGHVGHHNARPFRAPACLAHRLP
jgi:hypothetical protein